MLKFPQGGKYLCLLSIVGKLRHGSVKGLILDPVQGPGGKIPGMQRADLACSPSGILPLSKHPQISYGVGKTWLQGGQGKTLCLAQSSLLSCFW